MRIFTRLNRAGLTKSQICFIECWLSLTTQANIDTDRVTFNNPLHAIDEMLELYSHDDKFKAAAKRNIAAKELIGFLQYDPCLQHAVFASPRTDLIAILVRDNRKGKSPNPLELKKTLVQSYLVQLRHLIKVEYRRIAVDIIKDNITGNEAQNCTNTLCQVTNNLLSVLTTMGMPMYECYVLVRNFFLAGNRPFPQAFRALEENILADSSSITISLKLISFKLHNLLASAHEDGLDILDCSFHPIPHPQNNTVAVNISVDAISFSAAREVAIQHLNRSLDIMSVVIGRDKLTVEKKFQAFDGKVTKDIVYANQPLVTVSDRLLPKEFQLYKETITRLYESGEKITSNKVSASLNFLKIGLADESGESRFTALWSSLESLTIGVSQDQMSHDEHVLHAVLPCIGMDYPVKQLFALRGVAKELDWDPFVFEGHNILFQTDNMGTIYQALKSQEVKEELAQRLEDYPYAKYRFFKFIDICNDPDKLSKKIQAHMDKVEQQVHRMYRTRNAIVHNALVHERLDLLVVNLEHYLRSALNAMVYVMKESPSVISPEEAFNRIHFRCDQIISELDPLYLVTAGNLIKNIQQNLGDGTILRNDSKLVEWLALHV